MVRSCTATKRVQVQCNYRRVDKISAEPRKIRRIPFRVWKPKAPGSWDRALSRAGPAFHEARADEGHHQLALLVGAGVARKDDPPAGPALRGALFGDLRCVADGIADIDR